MRASLGFQNRRRAAAAALASLVAVAAITVYAAGPVAASPTVRVAYVASAQPTLRGRVVTFAHHPIRGSWVLVVFRTEQGRTTAIVRMPVNPRTGRWSTHAPGGARFARVVVHRGRGSHTQAVARTIRLRPGMSVSLTVMFPPRHSGLFPAVFPY